MSYPALPEWLAIFTNMITDGTPVNSASQSILSHMGETISATSKMKVGRNANFVLIRKVRFAV